MTTNKKIKKKVNYFKFNNGVGIAIVGLIFLIANFVIELLSETNIICLQIAGLLLFYLGIIIHLILVGDKPFVKSFNYIKKSKNFIYFIIGTFFLLTLIGYFIHPSDYLLDYLLKFIRELIEKTEGLSAYDLIKFIFFNNLQSSFFGLILGFFFGIFPIFFAVINGYVLGFVASMAVSEGGIFSLWRIFPHGIFELPAIFISLGLGLKFGYFILQKNRAESFKNYFWNSIRVFLVIVIPLLIIAAIIEGILISFAE